MSCDRGRVGRLSDRKGVDFVLEEEKRVSSYLDSAQHSTRALQIVERALDDEAAARGTCYMCD